MRDFFAETIIWGIAIMRVLFVFGVIYKGEAMRNPIHIGILCVLGK